MFISLIFQSWLIAFTYSTLFRPSISQSYSHGFAYSVLHTSSLFFTFLTKMLFCLSFFLSHTHIHPALLFLSSCRDTVSVFIQDYEWLSSQWGRPAKWNQSMSSLFCFVNDTLFGKWLFPFKRFHLKWKCRTIENKNRPPKDVQRSGIG